MNELQQFLDEKKSPYTGKTLSTSLHDYTTFVSRRASDPINIIFQMLF